MNDVHPGPSTCVQRAFLTLAEFSASISGGPLSPAQSQGFTPVSSVTTSYSYLSSRRTRLNVPPSFPCRQRLPPYPSVYPSPPSTIHLSIRVPNLFTILPSPPISPSIHLALPLPTHTATWRVSPGCPRDLPSCISSPRGKVSHLTCHPGLCSHQRTGSRAPELTRTEMGVQARLEKPIPWLSEGAP